MKRFFLFILFSVNIFALSAQCDDITACNYSATATEAIDCLYPPEGYDCIDLDCLGEWGGSAYEDDCGYCDVNPDNDNETCEQDCNGIWNGSAFYDPCGICNGDGTWCLTASITLGAATTTSLEVLYDSPLNIGGFQFNISGANVTGGSGGAAEANGFQVSAGGGTVLGFAFDGSVVPAGSGVLTNLAITATDFTGCISDIVLSDDDGDQFGAENENCVDLPCPADVDGDNVCDHSDPCIGIYDCAGECNGDAVEDCAGVCDGDAMLDECGVCEGGNYCDDGLNSAVGNWMFELHYDFDCTSDDYYDYYDEILLMDAELYEDGTWFSEFLSYYSYSNLTWNTDGNDLTLNVDSYYGGALYFSGTMTDEGTITGGIWGRDDSYNDYDYSYDVGCMKGEKIMNDVSFTSDPSKFFETLAANMPKDKKFEMPKNIEAKTITMVPSENNTRTRCEFVVGPDADCAGECFGDAALDDCGDCEGENAAQDCAGECDGDAMLDECGVCEGGNYCDDGLNSAVGNWMFELHYDFDCTSDDYYDYYDEILLMDAELYEDGTWFSEFLSYYSYSNLTWNTDGNDLTLNVDSYYGGALYFSGTMTDEGTITGGIWGRDDSYNDYDYSYDVGCMKGEKIMNDVSFTSDPSKFFETLAANMPKDKKFEMPKNIEAKTITMVPSENNTRTRCEFVVGPDADCAGECFGDAVEDCAGECEGDAYICDALGECVDLEEDCILLGDVNFDTTLDVLDVIAIVYAITEGVDIENGDLNEDGRTDIIDIVALVNMIMSDSQVDEAILCSYDLNGDSIINVVDIVLLVNYIMS